MKKIFLVFAVLITIPFTSHSQKLGQSQQAVSVSKGTIWSEATCAVCWENPSPADEAEREWVRKAVARTWEAESAFRFTGWGTCPKGILMPFFGIKILISDEGPHVKGLGSDLMNVTDGMVLNFTFNKWGPECMNKRQNCIENIAVHEFGHALGLAHEHNRTDCVFCDTKPQGKDGDWNITTCDLESVMNYCNPKWNGDGSLSDLDIEGVVALYGKAKNTYDISANNYNYLLGDFNGDGKTDLIHLVNNDYSHVWLSNGDGTYDIKPRFPATNGYALQNEANFKFLVGDVNGDGKSDLVHIVNNNLLTTWLSNGDGTFKITPRFPATDGYAMKNEANFMFLMADVNGDKKTDLVHIVNNNFLHVWLSNGDGTYAIKSRFPAADGYALKNEANFKFLVGDVNGDGRSDLIHIVNNNMLTTWLSNGDGTFKITPRFPAADGYALKNDANFMFLTADVNGDRKTDLVHIANNNFLHVWISNGDGTFAIKPRFPAADGYALKNEANYKFIVSDANGDGKQDLVHIANNNYMHVWISNGDGTYAIQPRFPANDFYALKNGGNFKFIGGKFDNDGKGDLIHIVNDRYVHTWFYENNGTYNIMRPFLKRHD